MPTRVLLLTALALAAVILPHGTASADIAPPETPPGSSLLPEDYGTAVRMLSETVTLTIEPDPQEARAALAQTHAVFTMRNLGHVDETMAARFPLSFPDGASDGRFEFPEIPSISVKVDGRAVPTRRELQPPIEGGGYSERDEIPWAVFDVTFPRDTDVVVEVSYTVKSYGYYPEAIFDYVLETGEAWNDSIGEVDIIVRLPYEANGSNILVEESMGASASTQDSVVSGSEIRWHYEDLEPTWQDNVQVILITPSLWQSVLKEREIVGRNPGDGEAWGRLAKAYKEAARQTKGWLRDDPGGRELVDLSRKAYEECLRLLPEDPLWHYGYADLLWSRYYFEVRNSPGGDPQALLPRLLSELQTTLELDPGNALARDLLLEISLAVDGAVERSGDEYIFLALTATPLPPTPFLDSGTPTIAPTAGVPTSTLAVSSTPARPAAEGGSPLCAGAFLSILLPIAVALRSRSLLRR